VFKGVSPSVLKGLEEFSEVELNVAAVLYERLRGGPDFAALVADTIREVDFLLAEGAVIYHVEVKTTTNPTDANRKKRMLLQKRQNVLEKLELRPALAVVMPKGNWKVEVWIEKTTS
jgi:predicted AAA+ superfamily ATPase